MKILIIGDGGHAQVVADLLTHTEDVEPVGFVCNHEVAAGETLSGLPLISEAALSETPHDGLVIALGDNKVRQSVFEQLTAQGETVIAAVHPSAVVAPDVIIEPGCMVCAGVVVNPGSRIRANTILNTGCTVDHHGDIGPHAHVGPGVNLAGNVNVNEGGFIGIGSCAIQGMTIGAWATVGAGGVVIEDVSPTTVVVGVPARKK